MKKLTYVFILLFTLVCCSITFAAEQRYIDGDEKYQFKLKPGGDIAIYERATGKFFSMCKYSNPRNVKMYMDDTNKNCILMYLLQTTVDGRWLVMVYRPSAFVKSYYWNGYGSWIYPIDQ